MFVKETSSRRWVLHVSFSFKSIFSCSTRLLPPSVCPRYVFLSSKVLLQMSRGVCVCVCMKVDACLCRFTVRLQRFLQHGGSVRTGSVRRPAINCSSGITKWEEMLNNHCTLHWLKRPPDHLKATLGFLVSQQSLQPQKHSKTIRGDAYQESSPRRHVNSITWVV